MEVYNFFALLFILRIIPIKNYSVVYTLTIPILQMEKVSHTVVRKLSQASNARKWWSGDSTQAIWLQRQLSKKYPAQSGRSVNSASSPPSGSLPSTAASS